MEHGTPAKSTANENRWKTMTTSGPLATTPNKTINGTFNFVFLVQSLCAHEKLRSKGFGFQLNAPFNFHIINAASNLVRMPIEDRESAKGDYLRVKLATLRTFARIVDTEAFAVTDSQVRSCLKLEKPIEPDEFRKRTNAEMHRLHHKGLLPLDEKGIKLRRAQIHKDLIWRAECIQEENRRMLNDVRDLANATGDQLWLGDTSRGLEPEVEYSDLELADFNDYICEDIVDKLLDKCQTPLILMRDFLSEACRGQNIPARRQVFEDLLTQVNALAAELGLSWSFVDQERANLDAILSADDAEQAAAKDKLQAILDEDDEPLDTSAISPRTTPIRVIKSPERLAREADDQRALQLKQDAIRQDAENARLAKVAEFEAAEAKKRKAAMAKANREAKARAAAQSVKDFSQLDTLMVS